jgi:hypothetical protein
MNLDSISNSRKFPRVRVVRTDITFFLPLSGSYSRSKIGFDLLAKVKVIAFRGCVWIMEALCISHVWDSFDLLAKVKVISVFGYGLLSSPSSTGRAWLRSLGLLSQSQGLSDSEEMFRSDIICPWLRVDLTDLGIGWDPIGLLAWPTLLSFVQLVVPKPRLYTV